MADLSSAIVYIQALMRQVEGVKAAPDYPPEQLDPFPFVVAFPGSGTWAFGGGGFARGLHTIELQVHIARKDLPHDVEAITKFVDLIPLKLLGDPTLGGTISTFGTVRYEFVPMVWNSVSTIGVRFFIEGVKMEQVL